MLETPKAFSPIYGKVERITMGNQQERTVGPEFLAGLIVGEGSFCIGIHRRRHDKLSATPIFRLGMNDVETVELAARSLQALDLPVYISKHKSNGMVIDVRGLKRLERYCLMFIPYLTGTKREAARVVLTFCLSRLSKPTNEPINEEEKDLIRLLRTINGNKNGKKNPL